MPAIRWAIPAAVVATSLTLARPAAALPPMTEVDRARTAAFWAELTGGPFAGRGDVLGGPNPFTFLRPIGASGPTRGFYMIGSDALHLVPRRIGFWGWGLMVGGEL